MALGKALGCEEGCPEGSLLGMHVEYAVGCVEGFIEGRPLGCVEDRDDGLLELGLADGFEVGRIVEPVNNVEVLP